MENTVIKRLFEMRDVSYRDFTAKLIPNIDSNSIIGVRIPELRSYAKELIKAGTAQEFLLQLPHRYLEENALHSFIICETADYDECISQLDIFLPYVNNWSTCDSMRPKCFAKNKERLSADIDRWLSSEHTYTVRFGILMLMVHFLDRDYDRCHSDKVASIMSEEYYVNMMIAWYFATALAKQYENILPYLTENLLSDFVHNKTIGKAIESYRISTDQKIFLRKLKRRA